MQTAAWGPHTWVLFHSVAFNYPQKPNEDDRGRYRRFYTGLGEILPCKYCRESYTQFLGERPLEPYLRDREGVIYWTYMIHDRVNRKLGKTSCPFEEYVQTYENMRAKCAKRANATGNLISGCIEPMRNFQSQSDVRSYAQQIWKTYHEKSPHDLRTPQSGGGGSDWISSLLISIGLLTGAVVLARP